VGDLIEVYKTMTGLVRVDSQSLFSPRVEGSITRGRRLEVRGGMSQRDARGSGWGMSGVSTTAGGGGGSRFYNNVQEASE